MFRQVLREFPISFRGAEKIKKKKKEARIERIEKQLENVSQRGVQAYAHLFSGSS